jgi:Na+/melibiose symporter-like transporter
VRRAWRLLARHRQYRLLLTAGLISLTGDWVLTVGLTYYVYRLTGSTLASGTMLLAVFIPQVILGPVAGLFADRWDRRATMVGTDLLLAVGLLPLLAVHHASQVWIIYLVALWQGCVEQFFTPAQSAAVPLIVDADELVAANGANGQVQAVARLIGSAGGGAAAGLGGLSAVAFIDAASFLVSALLLAKLGALRAQPRSGTAPAARDREPVDPRAAALEPALGRREEWTVGLRLVIRNRTLRLMLMFVAVSAVGEGIMLTLIAPFVRHILHGGASDYGTILALQAVGGIAGGIAFAAYGHRLGIRTLVGAGSVLFGALDLMLFLYPLIRPVLWPAGVLIALAGVPGAGVIAGYTTAVQVNTEDSYRGRVFGVLATMTGAGTLIGIAGAGLLGKTVGIVPVIAAQGAGYLLVGLLLTVALRPPAPAVPPTASSVTGQSAR